VKTESDKSFPRAKEAAFDVKAVQESQSASFLYSPKPSLFIILSGL